LHTRTPQSPPPGTGDTSWASRYGNHLASLYHLPADLPVEFRELAAKIAARTDADRMEEWAEALAADIEDCLIF
jgi:hypothetical protein